VKSAKAANLDSVLALATAPGTAEWARTELLAGIKYSLPRSPDGRTVAGGRWPAEPKSLLALAAQKDNPAAKSVQQTLDLVRWPGKPGGAAVRPLTEAEQALYEKGKAQFAALCAACHQPNGQGLAGLAPSLIYSKHVLGDPRILARIILNGKIQENLIMPPWKAALDDEQVSAVMTFLRRSWDHDADLVSKNIVAAVREELKGRADPFTEEQLAEVAATLRPMRSRR
ncbi:MAG TPA: c-type cytochrome, partial [Opitutaceae bacterium]